MAIFKDNYFTNDSYNLRTSRLDILKNYIEYWAAPLSVPRTLVEWGLHSHKRWQNILLASQSKKNQSDNIYQEMHNTDEKTFKYYLKCKRLLTNSYSQDKSLLESFGVNEKFPRNRIDKMRTIEKFLEAFQQIVDNENIPPIPQNFVAKLEKLFSNSQAFGKQIQQLKNNKPNGTDSAQMELFKEDSKKLRTLLSWTLMTWEPDEPYLVQLGFAVKPKKIKQEEENEEDDN